MSFPLTAAWAIITLLLAVLGNIIGTPLGWLCGNLCKLVSG